VPTRHRAEIAQCHGFGAILVIGIEDVRDIIADIDQALAASQT